MTFGRLLHLLLYISYCTHGVVVSVTDDGSPPLPTYFGGSDHNEYVAWWQRRTVPYQHSTFLPTSHSPSLGMAVYWTIQDERIIIAVAAKATGWVGFGISEAGGMKGADIILFKAETKELIDSHVLGTNAMPINDECQSWQLISSFVGHEFIIFEASRAIDSGDTQDRPILNDAQVFMAATRVIGAWGDSKTPSFHGSSHVKGALRFYGEQAAAGGVLADFRDTMRSEAEGSFIIGAREYAVPDWTRTTYGEFCMSSADLIASGVPLDDGPLHLVGIEPHVDTRGAPYVHHFLVYGSNVDCGGVDDSGPPLHELIFGWSPGVLPMVLPPSVGIPLGGSNDGYVSFHIQIHYDNPLGVAHILDSSGVVAHYTSKLRQHDMGILQVGDPFVAVQPPVLSELGGPAQHLFECSGACTGSYFQREVTVFAEGIHMHGSGRMGSNEILRNGTTVLHRAVSEYFDFAQQGGIKIQQEPYTLLPGDGVRLTCSYEAEVGAQWGANSHDEMCIAYLFYYPRQTINVGFQVQPTCAVGMGRILPNCEAQHLVTANYPGFDRTFGRVPSDSSCDAEADNDHDSGNRIPFFAWLKKLSSIYSSQPSVESSTPMLRSVSKTRPKYPHG